MACIDGSLTSLPKAEKIGFTVSIVTLVALVALASAGLRSNHLQSMLKLSKKTCTLTASVSGGVLAIVLGALGFRVLSNPAQISGKRGPDSRGTSSNEGDNFRATTLHAATFQGNVAIIKELLAAGADVNTTNSYGDTALHLAAGLGYREVVEALLAAGADVNTTNSYGDTALHAAAFQGNVAIIKALLAAGADVKVSNKKNETALDIAAFYDYPEIVQALEQLGATPMHEDAYFYSEHFWRSSGNI